MCNFVAKNRIMPQKKNKYKMKKLSEVGTLVSAARYSVLESLPENRGKQYVAFQKRHIPRHSFYSVLKHRDIAHDAYFFSPKDNFDIYYILFILNSYIGQTMVNGGPESKRNAVTLTTLSQVPVADIDLARQKACGYMEQMIEALVNTKDRDRYIDYRIQTFGELRDAIITELIADDIISFDGIDLMDSWCSMFDKYCNEDLMTSTEETAKVIFDELMLPSNQVMNNLKKFRISVRKFAALKLIK